MCDNGLSVSTAGCKRKTLKFYEIFEEEISETNSLVVDAVVYEIGE